VRVPISPEVVTDDHRLGWVGKAETDLLRRWHGAEGGLVPPLNSPHCFEAKLVFLPTHSPAYLNGAPFRPRARSHLHRLPLTSPR
jgi:hypothetical protein